MLSKCANPECSETLRYLNQGKIFRLAPTPEVQAATRTPNPALHERFWLCAQCAKEMTLVWGGTQVRLARLALETVPVPLPLIPKSELRRRSRVRAASAGREDS